MWLMILEYCCKNDTESLLALKDVRGGGVYSLIWLIRGCAAVQDLVFYLSTLMGYAISRKSILNSVRVLCPKQGYRIEGFVLNRPFISEYFCPKHGQGFKPSASLLFPTMVDYPRPPWKTLGHNIVLVDDDQMQLNWLSVIYSWLLRWVNVFVRSGHELFLRFFLWQIHHRWRCIVPLWQM